METGQDNITLIPLSAVQRIKARQNAAQAVVALAGVPPERKQFNNTVYSKYPAWIVRLILLLAVLVLLPAFLLSAMRLFYIGKETFYATIQHGFSAGAAGVAILILSEAAAVLFTLAFSVIGETRLTRAILLLSVVGTGTLALSGNYFVALEHHKQNVFTIAEALLPPLLTFSTAFVLKEVALRSVSRRHAENMAYEAALQDWKQATAQPEKHEDFLRFYATELRDELYKVNKRAKRRKSYMDGLTDAEWSGLVRETMKADEWYKAAVDTANEQRTVQADRDVHHSFTERTNEQLPHQYIQPVHSANERMNEYAFTPPDSVHSLNGNGHGERTANSGYRKTMNARDYVREYFADPRHAGHIDHSLDALEKEISTWAGVKVGRTTIHNVRKELEQAMVS